ncbi:urease accessory protein UreD [Oceanobacillus sp. FSL W7-1293]|uniref:urease accessory protein UreD n=1 Tax=Oceanobacillus TaxID=182709 RepID=UPI0030D18CD1
MQKEWTGELQLELTEKKNKTVPADVYFRGAFKVMRPIYLDNSGQLTYYLLNPGGGYLSADTYSMDIRVNENARAILTTQSATKVYKTPGEPAYQYGKFTLKSNSLLEYIPDPLIVYREGSYKQLNQFYVDNTSTLICSDIITPGWSPTGKQFSYDKVDLQNEVFIHKELGVFDRIVTEPAKNNPSVFGRMEGYSHLGSMMVISPYVTDEVIENIYDMMEQKDVNFGISRCPVPGFSLRILANQTQIIEEILQTCHGYLRETWFGMSPVFLRKY